MTTTAAPTTPRVPAAASATPTRPAPKVRIPHLAVGLALTTAAIALAVTASTGAGSVLIFGVLPDVALLAAIGSPHAPGQLPARAVPLYNVLHHPSVPILLGIAAVVALGAYWAVAALAWGAHIAIDRGVGYGLRTADGWQRA